MRKNLFKVSVFIMAFIAFSITSCNDDDDTRPSLRAKIDYNTLTAETPYSELFVDESGATTVDLFEGNTRYKMFYSINNYASSSTSAEIEAGKLKNMFANTGDAFYDISNATISIDGAELNGAGVQLKNVVASSLPATEAEAVRAKIESLFDEIAVASQSFAEAASAGQAGKLGTRLVDAKGIELAQVIQKSIIGGLELDFIANVLLDEGLNGDNFSLVSGKPYTQLEHFWDEAYGLLTLNPVYLEGSTNDTRGTAEFGLGSYMWEYNKANYANIYPAFLKGRAAIVNNDRATLQAQAIFIRTEFEKAVAGAALGYLDKWTNPGATEADQAHAIGEGLGFIYSLRFATIHGADAAFSDDIIEDLVGSENGFWDITAEKINTASAAIANKFNL